MKKLLLLSAVASALSASLYAQEKTENEKWVAGFVEYYSTDQAETGFPNYLDNGYGIGAEFGFKFTPEWAARLEASSLRIDTSSSSANSSHESGSRVGVDALYFMPHFYAFGGLKYTKIADGDMMANIGLGKHWDTDSKVKIITEVAAYQNISGDSYTHLGFKVGLAYAFGDTGSSAPKDSDNDGVFDNVDECANTPMGTSVDSLGCALDADGDGVLNTIDMCPDTPAGTKVNTKGCRLLLDTDQDGILDDADNCADTPMTDKVDANGCSVFVEEEVSTNLNVSFGNNSSIIDSANNAQFQAFADFMERFPGTDAVIEGHASAPGDADYNMMISQKRANAVRTLLINEYGISAARLIAKGFGENQLLDTSNTAAANKANRRITAKVSTSTRIKVQR